jgi:hypothetical protein
MAVDSKVVWVLIQRPCGSCFRCCIGIDFETVCFIPLYIGYNRIVFTSQESLEKGENCTIDALAGRSIVGQPFNGAGRSRESILGHIDLRTQLGAL